MSRPGRVVRDVQLSTLATFPIKLSAETFSRSTSHIATALPSRGNPPILAAQASFTKPDTQNQKMPAIPSPLRSSISLCINSTIAADTTPPTPEPQAIAGAWIPALAVIFSLVLLTCLGSCLVFSYTRRRARKEKVAARLAKLKKAAPVGGGCFRIRKCPRRREDWAVASGPGGGGGGSRGGVVPVPVSVLRDGLP
ncbi:hypothetical protein B0T25DRAFT_574657 [Lasiosphaeria hispida]|uniref:Uncharacterized protein n=1 Tax=Lasiosphaeria hispida TaxID=260671 RepID=A0AAJ0H576_9PEZI|nr:hypothetical protein B0T25DRAFT_574657 [Lasiosphaeria hispida]